MDDAKTTDEQLRDAVNRYANEVMRILDDNELEEYNNTYGMKVTRNGKVYTEKVTYSIELDGEDNE